MTRSFREIRRHEHGRKYKLAGAMSIGKTGNIGLPGEIVTKYNLSKDTPARLYWDKASRELAVTFSDATSPDKDGTYPMRAFGQGGYISAAKFFKAVALNPETLKGDYKYEMTRPEDVGLPNTQTPAFILNLNQPLRDSSDGSRWAS